MWRNHDPQIGRFIQIDPFTDKYRYNSTYAFSENKVTAHRELEGLEAVPVNGRNENLEDFYIGDDGMIRSSRIIQNRILRASEHPLHSNIAGIVLHRTAGSTVNGALDGMISRKLGVHFIIDNDGTITQLSSLNFWLSHVGKPLHVGQRYNSTNTIGIEHVGRFNNETRTWEPLTQPQIDASTWLVQNLMRIYDLNLANILPHERLSQKQPGEGQIIFRAILPNLSPSTPPPPPPPHFTPPPPPPPPLKAF